MDQEVDLGAYHHWLYKVAADLLPDGFWDAGIDDLVQEGRIAMWKAYEKYEDSKGTLAPWLVNAARMRMRDLATGHGQPTGHEARRGVVEAVVVPEHSVDTWEDDNSRTPSEHNPEVSDPLLMDALLDLPEEQREYVWLRFWAGVDITSRSPGITDIAKQFPVLKKRQVWRSAREQLACDPRILKLRELDSEQF